MRSMKPAISILLLSLSLTAHSETTTDSLSTCLSDSTSGSDRKDLAIWMYTAMSSHPEMNAIAPISQEQKEESAKKAGELFTRLMTEDCKEQLQASSNNASIISSAYENLGKIAMLELLSNPNVKKASKAISKHMDLPRIQNTISETSETN